MKLTSERLAELPVRMAEQGMLRLLVGEVEGLEAEIERLKKEAEPFRAQIDQRKTYKGPEDDTG